MKPAAYGWGSDVRELAFVEGSHIPVQEYRPLRACNTVGSHAGAASCERAAETHSLLLPIITPVGCTDTVVSEGKAFPRLCHDRLALGKIEVAVALAGA